MLNLIQYEFVTEGQLGRLQKLPDPIRLVSLLKY